MRFIKPIVAYLNRLTDRRRLYSKMKLTLRLKNFGVHRDASFEIDSRYVLVTGPSGCGKTTLLSAIVFCLTGAGKKTTTFGEKSSSATLTLHDEPYRMTIVRSKGPRRLLVTRDGVEYEDGLAQALIDEIAPRWNYGYVSQRLYKSFVSSTPAEKLTFIEESAFGGEDVGSLKERCRDLLATRRDRLNRVSAERRVVGTFLSEEMGVDADSTPVPSRSEHDRSPESYESEANELDARALLAETRIASAVRARLELETIRSSGSLDDAEDAADYEKIDIEELLGRRDAYAKYLDAAKRLERCPPFSGLTESDLRTAERIDALRRKTLDAYRLSEEFETVSAYRATHAVSVECPVCHADLVIGTRSDEPEISVASDRVRPIDRAEASRIDREWNRLKLETENSRGWIDELRTLETERPDLVDLDDARRRVESDRERAKCERAERTLRVDPPPTDVQSLVDRTRRRLRTEAARKRAVELETILNEASELKSTITESRERASALRRSAKECRVADRLRRYAVLRSEETSLDEIVQRAARLRAIIDEAERAALSSTIRAINSAVTRYTRAFFDDGADPIVRLVFSEKRRCIDTTVELDGRESDLQSLSGGEFARVALAFAVAIAQLNGVPLLLLDESFASLDVETVDRVTDRLKSEFDGTVIVVAHQTTIGSFDSVVEINNPRLL